MSSEKAPTILIVDDEEDILELLAYNLEQEGYQTLVAKDGQEAVRIAESKSPELIILDVMMPNMDGLQACSILREHPGFRNTPILMLTAKTEDSYHVSGLEAGADIYLKKPISIPVLLSQVKAALRGSGRSEDENRIVRIHDLVIDKNRYIVKRTGADAASFRLPRKEFELLHFLSSRPGVVYTRQNLLDRVWGTDVFVGDRTIDVHIRKIRGKIGDHYIETVKGVGYRFTP
ncbi:MAG: response regulator transcription factor [Rhodothermia bacterium]|nr:MAG: response regulator transcription factor [Rhodothermia bacterium]